MLRRQLVCLVGALLMAVGTAYAQQDTLVLDGTQLHKLKEAGGPDLLYAPYDTPFDAPNTAFVPQLPATASGSPSAYLLRFVAYNPTERTTWVLLLEGNYIAGLQAVSTDAQGQHHNLVADIDNLAQGSRVVALPIVVASGESITIQLKVRELGMQPVVASRSAYYNYFHQRYLQKELLLTAFLAVGLMLLVLGLIYLIASGNNRYALYIISYSLLLLHLLLYNGYLELFLARVLPVPYLHLSLATLLISQGALLMYAKRFLKVNAGTLLKLYHVARVFNFGILVLALGLFVAGGLLPSWFRIIVSVPLLLNIGWMTAAGLAQRKANPFMAKQFLAAHAILFAGYGLGSVFYWIKISTGWGGMESVIDGALLLGSLVQFLVLLMYQVRRMRFAQEKLIAAQQETIMLIEENHSITEEYAQELEHQLAELKKAKDQLALSEKLSTLGQLAAGIIHEVNTPLGVSKASVENLERNLNSLAAQPIERLRELPTSDVRALEDLTKNLAFSSGYLSSKEERALRRRYTEQLEHWQVQDAEGVAAKLVMVNYHDSLAPFEGFFRSPNAPMLFDIAFTIAASGQNLKHTATALAKIGTIVQSLKRYAHPDSHARIERLNLAENVQTIAILYAYQIKHKAVLTTDFDDDCYVMAQNDELGQVWTNLIVNALQAMPEQGGQLEILVRKDPASLPPAVTVTVTDNGSGIPPEVLPKIFDPFFTTKPKGEGTGIGLSLCQEIVTLYGGTISVASEPGSTVFTTRFPAA